MEWTRFNHAIGSQQNVLPNSELVLGQFRKSTPGHGVVQSQDGIGRIRGEELPYSLPARIFGEVAIEFSNISPRNQFFCQSSMAALGPLVSSSGGQWTVN